ncbi:MAG: hypothetical protein K8S62_00705 [Candidatus Sabulitectum sp.]|nr:hypothetical protein [Candidatus Sabulitectum sp.]
MVSIVFMTVIFMVTAAGEELPSIQEIIQREGQFVFTDGSSVFQFYCDGSFIMEPASLCGRAVEGKWTSLDFNRMQINGTWTWYNGISAINDQRRMTIFIYLLSMETQDSELLWRSSDARMYDVYFVVEEIIQVN